MLIHFLPFPIIKCHRTYTCYATPISLSYHEIWLRSKKKSSRETGSVKQPVCSVSGSNSSRLGAPPSLIRVRGERVNSNIQWKVGMLSFTNTSKNNLKWWLCLFGWLTVWWVSSDSLSGRTQCECQALKHKLINNCMHCGRVVCEQEGAGPCLFCGRLVSIIFCHYSLCGVELVPSCCLLILSLGSF